MNDTLKENQIKLIQDLAKPFIDTICEIGEDCEDTNTPTWYWNRNDDYVMNEYVTDVISSNKKDLSVANETIKLLKPTLQKSLCEYIFDKLADDHFELFQNIVLNNLIFDDIGFNDIVEKRIIEHRDDLFNKRIIDSNISENKICLTMFRYDKSLQDNIEQNVKFEVIFKELLKKENITAKIQKSEGFWYEDGDTSTEPGYTIVADEQNINKLIPLISNMMSNLESFNLNKEHQQAAFYVKINDKAFIYEKSENSYEKTLELTEQIAFKDSNILNAIKNDKSGKLNYIGGTTDQNNVTSMSLNKEQKEAFLEAIKDIIKDNRELKISDNRSIQHFIKHKIKEYSQDITF